MRALTANDAISIWESGQRQRPAERSVAVLSAVFPETSRVDLRRLTLGQCNGRLWEIRNRIFGAEVKGFSECANCGERLEFSLDAAGLEVVEGSNTEHRLEINDYTVRFRLLTLEDLNAVAASADMETARERLLERCVIEAGYKGELVAVSELPPKVTEELGRQLAEFDSGCDVLIDLSCPACDSSYEIPFDISSFLYTEISAQAQRLLREVHVLARAYGWQERDILGMSTRRRQFYLQMLER
ncbi:MAG TPA: hypothetical protein VK475_10845 [Pyrinomonadaceae bacterium]|nr:hypothetical protein [Pyrinomonadaceae bacterium]